MQVHTVNSSSQRGSQIRQEISKVLNSSESCWSPPEFQPPPPQSFGFAHDSWDLWQHEHCTKWLYRKKLPCKLLLAGDEEDSVMEFYTWIDLKECATWLQMLEWCKHCKTEDNQAENQRGFRKWTQYRKSGTEWGRTGKQCLSNSWFIALRS